MPTIRKIILNSAAAGTEVPLGAFNRFGGRGGAIQFRATCTAATPNLVSASLQIGSDIITDRAIIPGEKAVGSGPDSETQVLGSGVGAPGDPILITLFGDGAVDCVVQAEVTNL